MLKLDLIQTLAFAGVILFLGYGLRNLIPLLARYNLPAPAIGGLLVAISIVTARHYNVTLFQFDDTLRLPLMIAFFTSLGFGASVSLLRSGGPQVLLLFGVSTVFAIMQNVVGIVLSFPLGIKPLFGVLAGSVTLAGGPATGLAFAAKFSEAGVAGAETIAVASGMTGIVTASILASPIGTYLIERYKLQNSPPAEAPHSGQPAKPPVETLTQESPDLPVKSDDFEYYELLKGLVLLLVAMWLGSYLSSWLSAKNITLPPYIGSMIVAMVIRNFDDATKLFGISPKVMANLGSVSLSLFLTMALMMLKLWELAGLAFPLLVILVVQIAMITGFSLFVFLRLFGRDYDAAVMSSGFCGYMLGITANAMASMRALVERYGPAPRAFLAVPIVGAFFIDFANNLMITVCLNLFR